MDWELISFIKKSNQRIKILMVFHSSLTPSEIVRKTGFSPSHVSRTLKDFSDKGLVKCNNPKAHTGRLYSLLDKGEEIQQVLKSGEIADKYSE